tara:strand:- start:252 stop:392 length:141 start_codon:yes stop_codon:yes gene_type:complete
MSDSELTSLLNFLPLEGIDKNIVKEIINKKNYEDLLEKIIEMVEDG